MKHLVCGVQDGLLLITTPNLRGRYYCLVFRGLSRAGIYWERGKQNGFIHLWGWPPLPKSNPSI